MPVRISVKVSSNRDPVAVPEIPIIGRPIKHIDLTHGYVEGAAALGVLPPDHPLWNASGTVAAKSEWRFFDGMTNRVESGSRVITLPKVRIVPTREGEDLVIEVPLHDELVELGRVPITPGLPLDQPPGMNVLVGDNEQCAEYALSLEHNFRVDHLADVVDQNALLLSQVKEDLRQWLKNYEADWRENPHIGTAVDLRRLAEDVLPCHWEIEESGFIFNRSPEYELLARVGQYTQGANRVEVNILTGYCFMDGVTVFLGDIRATVRFQ